MTEKTADRRPKVLLVDDEPAVLRALQRCLRAEACDLLAASSGAEALHLLEDHEVDLIMSDLRMPSMGGLELLREAQQVQPGAVRIILTAYGDVTTALEALADDTVYRFLNKPWSDRDLRDTVRQALEYRATLRGNESLERRLNEPPPE